MMVPSIVAALLLIGIAIWAHRASEGDDRFVPERLRGIAGSVMVVLIGLMVFYLSYRHFERWDWTSEQRFTLSQQSTEVVSGLERPVDIYLFVDSAENEGLGDLVAQYQAASSMVTVHRVSPDRQPGEFRLLAERFQIGVLQTRGGASLADVAAVVASGDRHYSIDRDDLRAVDMSSLEDEDGPKLDVKAEEAFTSALIQVTTGRDTTICMLSGHGEISLTGGAGGQRNMTAARRRLERSRVVLRTVDTRTAIDPSCDALFVVGPQRRVSSADVERVETYLSSGGNVLLALDPIFEEDRLRPTGFESLVRQHGIELGTNLVLELDPSRLTSPDPLNVFLASQVGAHEMMAPLAGMDIGFLLAQSVTPIEGGDAEAVLFSSEASFAESSLEDLRALEPGEGDIRGPVPFAAAVTLTVGPETDDTTDDAANDEGDEGEGDGEADAPDTEARLVVIGDSEWLISDFIDQPTVANATMLNAVSGWLTERQALISVPPRQASLRPMAITTDDLWGWNGVAVRVLLLLPGAMALLGMAVFWQRRS